MMENESQKNITQELVALELRLKQSINSDIELATEVSSYIVKSGGKRIRPTITILIAKALGYRGTGLINLATAIELLHTATLIHDDVVDQSEIRRGKTSIHKRWDNAHGVLVGDFVYSKAFQLMASLKDKKIIQTLADSTNKISEGEVLQLKLQGHKDLKEKDYFEIIGRKTAELFKASAHTGALIAKSNKTLLKLSCEFAYSLGIAFQLRDDLLDYSGKKEKTGKTIGKDFLEGKMTLPLIKALEFSNEMNLKIIKDAFKRKNKEKLTEVIQIINKSGAIKEVENISHEYSSNCLKLLNKFPQNAYKKSLEDLVLSLKERAK